MKNYFILFRQYIHNFTIAAVTSLIIVITQDDEIYGLVDWDQDFYRGKIPPEPQFNSNDNEECIEGI